MLRRLAVFASRLEIDTPDALAAAFEVGRLLGENRIVMLYGGADVGAVATAAERARVAGGQAIGFSAEETFRAEVASSADGLLGLPGGFATLEEAFEVWEWSAGSDRQQPLGLLDFDDYYSKLLRQASDGAVDRFVTESQRGRLIVGKDPEDLLRRLAEYRPPETRRQEGIREEGFD